MKNIFIFFSNEFPAHAGFHYFFSCPDVRYGCILQKKESVLFVFLFQNLVDFAFDFGEVLHAFFF